jgi:hypothetical protein
MPMKPTSIADALFGQALCAVDRRELPPPVAENPVAENPVAENPVAENLS